MNKMSIFILMVAAASLLHAHRVNIFAQVEGDSIVGQCYYSDGAPVRNQNIEVFRSSGEKLMELQTDSGGNFRFIPRIKDDLKIVLYAGMGHRAEITINANDLPEITATKARKPETSTRKVETVVKKAELDEEALRKVVEAAVEEKFNTLRQLIMKQQKSISLTTIIGGIGYIFGIFGLIVLLWRRKRS
jgi:nickel transport protein